MRIRSVVMSISCPSKYPFLVLFREIPGSDNLRLPQPLHMVVDNLYKSGTHFPYSVLPHQYLFWLNQLNIMID